MSARPMTTPQDPAWAHPPRKRCVDHLTRSRRPAVVVESRPRACDTERSPNRPTAHEGAGQLVGCTAIRNREQELSGGSLGFEVMRKCPYYKRVSHTRIVFTLTFALSVAAVPNASVDDPGIAIWPVAMSWSSDFAANTSLSLVIGESRLFAVEGGAVSAWSDGRMQWKNDVTATARPVVDEGRLFVPTTGAIRALSAATGAEEWQLAGVSSSVSPAAKSGWLIATTEDHSLVGVNSSQGREVWRIALPAPLRGPVVIDGELIVGAGADGAIRAWQITDGSLRWDREIGTAPNQLLAARGSVFVGGEDGRLISLRQRDGRINWAYRYNMPIVGQLAVDEWHIYATTIDNSVHAHEFNGHQRWHQLLAGRIVNGMFSDSGTVFVPQSDGEIRMYVAKTGTRAGRIAARPESRLVGGLASGGEGAGLWLAVTVATGPRITLTTYRRNGLAAVPATSGPPGPALPLTMPGGRP